VVAKGGVWQELAEQQLSDVVALFDNVEARLREGEDGSASAARGGRCKERRSGYRARQNVGRDMERGWPRCGRSGVVGVVPGSGRCFCFPCVPTQGRYATPSRSIRWAPARSSTTTALEANSGPPLVDVPGLDNDVRPTAADADAGDASLGVHDVRELSAEATAL